MVVGCISVVNLPLAEGLDQMHLEEERVALRRMHRPAGQRGSVCLRIYEYDHVSSQFGVPLRWVRRDWDPSNRRGDPFV